MTDVEERPVLGGSSVADLATALRLSRQRSTPPLRLVDIGSDPQGPRSWSHAHLSKVERGLEIPTGELVRWYEVKTGTTPGFLTGLWELVTGEHYIDALPPAESVAPWTLDRVEIDLDLSGEVPTATETRDLIANIDGADRHQILIDLEDEEAAMASRLQILDGGSLVEEKKLVMGNLVRHEIFHGRVAAKGEWHRVTLRHVYPSENFDPWYTFTTKTDRMREGLVTVRFGKNAPKRVYAIDRLLSKEVRAFCSSAAPDEASADFTPVRVDEQGIARIRFAFPRAGFEYGIGWRSDEA